MLCAGISTGSHLFKPLRYRLGCHLIATLVKRLWLSYTTGLHSGYPLDRDTA
jgi:hypothetical protein